ncbi:Nuclear protein export factor [Plasmopara halstedii]|uniref:Nuclear protein export factor n=1 Tax=Plasmopara halstedii TaxID=4781 RepID=A0A0P1B0S0_PLAHL|nr:Nuclear protein export factor [Plasmopara halstedii]CEG47785.1 Nuclear protein export factor [Plasmopara halstedii]|eukprot:XP_024584154.1 Nuclear protein export factor [Plasmopara halstedii]
MSSFPEPIRGNCYDFCPAKERIERTQTQELSRFECPTKEAPDLVPVKKYRRAAAGRNLTDPSDLRPEIVLQRTLQYLFTTVLPRIDICKNSNAVERTEFLAVYHFVSDRIRSIRQDYIIQQITGTSYITALEQIVRFYIITGLRAIELVPSGTLCQDWSEKLHDQQLISALSELQMLYDQTNMDAHEISEFLAYNLLLHAKDSQTIASILLKSSSPQRQVSNVQRALRTFVALQTDDYHEFWIQFHTMSRLEQALALRHLTRIWTQSIEMMKKSFRSHEWIPVDEISKWFGLEKDSKLVVKLCQNFNIQTRSTQTFIQFQTTGISNEIDVETFSNLLRDVAIQFHFKKFPTIDFIQTRPKY